MKTSIRHITGALILACVSVTTAQATPIRPVSYSMHNGQFGTYTYHDDSYTGVGSRATAMSYLSGGLGDLTDGITAIDRWFTDPEIYVGWSTIDPLIIFDFGDVVNIDTITLYVDDSDGIHGVSTPGSVAIDGRLFEIIDPEGMGPRTVTITDLDFSGSQLELQLFEGVADWIFVSEIAFESRVLVAEPAVLALFGLGFIGLIVSRRRCS